MQWPKRGEHGLAVLRNFLNWCIRRGYLDTSPCAS